MIHYRDDKHDFSRECSFCGEKLHALPEGHREGSVEEWLVSPESCKRLRPITLDMFLKGEVWSRYQMDHDVIEISSEKLTERAARVIPYMPDEDTGELTEVVLEQPEHLRNRTFGSKDATGRKITIGQCEELLVTPTMHACGYHAFFKPSIAEVLAQLPDDPRINGFYLDRSVILICRCGGGHIVRTHWIRTNV